MLKRTHVLSSFYISIFSKAPSEFRSLLKFICNSLLLANNVIIRYYLRGKFDAEVPRDAGTRDDSRLFAFTRLLNGKTPISENIIRLLFLGLLKDPALPAHGTNAGLCNVSFAICFRLLPSRNLIEIKQQEPQRQKNGTPGWLMEAANHEFDTGYR